MSGCPMTLAKYYSGRVPESCKQCLAAPSPMMIAIRKLQVQLFSHDAQQCSVLQSMWSRIKIKGRAKFLQSIYHWQQVSIAWEALDALLTLGHMSNLTAEASLWSVFQLRCPRRVFGHLVQDHVPHISIPQCKL